MKKQQQRKEWITADGKSVPEKYIPTHEKVADRIGRKIAAKALEFEKKIDELREEFAVLAQEVLDRTPGAKANKRFTFYSFDRHFKFEYEIVEGYVRVYHLVGLSSKNYVLVDLDANRSRRVAEPIQTSVTPELPLFENEEDAIMFTPAAKEIKESDEVLDEMADAAMGPKDE
jgi:hypothetical protein